MNPLVASHSGRQKHPDDSWRIGRLLASLLIFLATFFAVWWQYRSEFISILPARVPLQGLTKIGLKLFGDYLCVSTVSTAAFSVVIIFVFLKITNLTSSKPSPEIMTCESSCSAVEIEGTNTHIPSASQDDDGEMLCQETDSIDMTLDTYTQLYDVLNAENDKKKSSSPMYEDTNESRDVKQKVRPNGYPVPGLQSVEDIPGLVDTDGLTIHGPVCCSSLDMGMETSKLLHDHCKGQLSCQNQAIQTEEFTRPIAVSAGTMTMNPQLVDASVGSQNVFKIVRSSETSTSGPFMKKLRRAQRLLNEARVRFKTERQSRLVEWKLILSRYKDRVKIMLQSLEKKDILMSYTALNRALSENEVKDMCTTVSSARDRLLTQCKLNFALKEVVESKCDSGTSDPQGQSSAGQS